MLKIPLCPQTKGEYGMMVKRPRRPASTSSSSYVLNPREKPFVSQCIEMFDEFIKYPFCSPFVVSLHFILIMLYIEIY